MCGSEFTCFLEDFFFFIVFTSDCLRKNELWVSSIFFFIEPMTFRSFGFGYPFFMDLKKILCLISWIKLILKEL